MKAHPENVRQCGYIVLLKTIVRVRLGGSKMLKHDGKKLGKKMQVTLIVSWPKQCCTHSYTCTAVLNLHREKNTFNVYNYALRRSRTRDAVTVCVCMYSSCNGSTVAM